MDGIAGLGIAIAGGASDIGSAMAAELTKHGGAVTLIDRKTPTDALPWIGRAAVNGPVSYVQANVTDRPAIDQALSQMNRLDVAIGNQAIGHGIPFLDITQDQWKQHMEINLTGCFNVGQAAARLMVERDVQGRILFTGSWVQEVPWPEISAYSTSKAGVRMLARSMARELATYGIRVNVIAPGIVYAGLAKHQLETEPQYARRVIRSDPTGRFADTRADRPGHRVPLLRWRFANDWLGASGRWWLLALPVRRKGLGP